METTLPKEPGVVSRTRTYLYLYLYLCHMSLDVAR